MLTVNGVLKMVTGVVLLVNFINKLLYKYISYTKKLKIKKIKNKKKI